MGSRNTRPSKGQPNNAYLSGSPTNDQTAIATVNEDSNASAQEDNGLKVPLVNINQKILTNTRIGDLILLRRFEAHTQKGRLGDIPYKYQKLVQYSSLKEGRVINLKIPSIYLYI